MSQVITQVDVVGLGENTVDTLVQVNSYPARGDKRHLLSSSRQPGGQIASALVVCRRLGLTARYLGKVGHDDDGRTQMESLRAEAIDTNYCSTVSGGTTRTSIIIVDQVSGERTILWHRDPRLTVRAEELRRNVICGGRVLFLDAQDVSASIRAARWAREAGIPVVADLETVQPGIEDLLPHLTHLIAAQEFPSKLTGLDKPHACLVRISEAFGIPVVGMTLGIDGAFLLDREDYYYSPGFQVEAIDTTGAGDVFHGAFIYALFKKWPWNQVLDFANALASLNCTALGARGCISTQERADLLITQGERNVNEIYCSSADSSRIYKT